MTHNLLVYYLLIGHGVRSQTRGLKMLEYFFKQRYRLLQLRRGPLAEHLDGLARELHSKGYRPWTGRQILSIAGRLNTFARIRGITSASQVDDVFVERFLKEELTLEGDYKYAPNALMHLMDYLQRKCVIQSPREDRLQDPDEDLMISYNNHLIKIRGLTQATCDGCLRGARIFLRWYREQHPGCALGDLLGSDVMNFVIEAFGWTHTTTWKKRICCDVRSFLRYLRWEGIISLELDRVIPSIPHWRLARIPRHLRWTQVRKLIDSINTDTAEGKRDKAIILLIASLGLRAKEVYSLQFSHIMWKSSEIRFPSTKSSRERVLPLTSEVGEALTDYILNGRPEVEVDKVFISHKAPVGPYASAGSISSIIRKRLRQAKIKAPSPGAHMLRHSLATRMINNGVSISNIANILGHTSIKTTAIYTKVDVKHLASVALPFWEGEER